MAGSEIKVLVRIVDDDSDLRAAIRFLLESEGWELPIITALPIFSSTMTRNPGMSDFGRTNARNDGS